ncbi:hypothetical protein E4U37_003156 [Claviceps purpurea]|nr:hypothetical protein E4U37_003156 [Claviceps purpurea]
MTADSSSPLKSDPSRSTAPDTSDSCNAHTRLHITPLDQDLLKVVLPASVLPQARNISLHTLETFPEKRYGYVDLPEADAEKLRKRLNGTTFKGVKMRIEKARPMPVQEPEDAEAAAAADARKDRKKRKAEEARDGKSKRRRDLNVVEGVLLKDRKVKRGWTESTDSKVRSKRSKDKHADKDKDKEKHKTKRLKSKYTDQDECLLKTRLPPNVAANLPASEAHKKKKTKNKSLARQITVHEFERATTFPSFLKHVVPERTGKEPVEFVQGKGWVDEDGALVEAVQCKDRREDVRGGSKKRKEKKGKKQKEEIVESDSDEEDDTSSSGTSSDEDEDDDEDRDADMSVADTPPTDSAIASPQKETRPLRKDPVLKSTRPSSSSSSSSSSASSSASSTSDDDDDDDDDDDTPEDQPQSQQEQEQEQGQEHQTNLTLDIPTTKTPHPLEALYKRETTTTTAATTTPAQAPTPFSFFAHDPEESPNSPEPHTAPAPAPTTPYTRQDLEYRNLRSAAPTPDTANPARRRAFWAPLDHDQEEDYEEDYNEEDQDEEEGMGEGDGEGDGEGGAGKGDAQRGEAGDFQSWFWQNRRDLNQAWMNRRKTAAKERRHRENKARASKAI